MRRREEGELGDNLVTAVSFANDSTARDCPWASGR
jgi:hypothetical protein